MFQVFRSRRDARDTRGDVKSEPAAAAQPDLRAAVQSIGEAAMHKAGRVLDSAPVRSESFLKVSEHLTELVAECGTETEDTPSIQAAKEAAAQVSKLLEDALRSGTLQICRRDVSGGKFVLLKEAAPITVNGKHWGGVRLAFNF